MQRRLIVFCWLLGALMPGCDGCTSNTPVQCSDATPVALLNDDAIPTSVKNAILYQPGQVVSVYVPGSPSEVNGNFPSGKVVVMPVESADYARNTAVTANSLDDLYFDNTAGSMSTAQFFSWNSWGDFTITPGADAGWTTIAAALADYKLGNTPYYIEANPVFARDVLRIADVDWGALDANNNGTIEFGEAQLIFVFPNFNPNAPAGVPIGWASVRYPNIGTTTTPYGSFNFGQRPVAYLSVRIATDPNASQPYYAPWVINHELGHAFFGFIDRYGDPNALGAYELMSSPNSDVRVHYNIHDKMKIGWIQPHFIAGHAAKLVRFNPAEEHPSSLILLKPPVNGNYDTNEYWIVEYRNQNAGMFDDMLPEAGGLAIYYIRKNGYAPDTNYDEIRLVDANRADQDPDNYLYGTGYVNNKALWHDRPEAHELYTANNQKSGVWFKGVTQLDSVICAEF